MENPILWTTEKRNTKYLIPAEYNPRKIDDVSLIHLKKSISKFSLADPIIINTNNHIIGGHQRIKAIGPDVIIDVRLPSRELTIEEEKELNLRLNKNTGEFDFDLLAIFGEGMLKDVGFSSQELDKIFKDINGNDKDDIVPENVHAIAQRGDIYHLGRHRVMCGDSTDGGDVALLFDGNKIDLAFSDPPYGIDVVQGSKVGGGGETHFGKIGGSKIVDSKSYSAIIGDDTTDTAKKFYNLLITLELKNIVLWGGNYYTNFLPPSRCWLIWDKEMTGNFSQAEMAWTTFITGGVRIYKHLWNGLSRAGDRKSEGKTRVHPTQKPVTLFCEIFRKYDDLKTIFDGFLGSGSTLIACEKTNRICYGMEIDPHYVDVIIKRWEDFTGGKAIKL